MTSTCGVVGYHIRLTRERSPVRTRVSAYFYQINYKASKSSSLLEERMAI